MKGWSPLPSCECCNSGGHSHSGSKPSGRDQDQVKYSNIDPIINCLWSFKKIHECCKRSLQRGLRLCKTNGCEVCFKSKKLLGKIFSCFFSAGRGCQPCTEALLPVAVVLSAGTLSSGSPMSRSRLRHAQSGTKRFNEFMQNRYSNIVK